MRVMKFIALIAVVVIISAFAAAQDAVEAGALGKVLIDLP